MRGSEGPGRRAADHEAFDDVDMYLERMDRRRERSVLSCSVRSAGSRPSPRSVSSLVPRVERQALGDLPGARRPLCSLRRAAPRGHFSGRRGARRQWGPGFVGAQIPANASSRGKTLNRCFRCSRSRTVIARFSSFTTVRGQAMPSRELQRPDNARRANGTLDMQANLSSVMVTLS